MSPPNVPKKIKFEKIQRVWNIFVLGNNASQFARELLWKDAGEACALAQCLHLVADEYVTASSQHLLTPINQLGRLMLPPDEGETEASRLQMLQVFSLNILLSN